QDSSLTHSTLQLRATMSAIRHPCLIMGQCPSNFEGRNIPAYFCCLGLGGDPCLVMTPAQCLEVWP
ncbi:MAG: hypothetical protein BECKG1743E_GA0114224_109213, partial [Candidatus Kentron sp. G]